MWACRRTETGSPTAAYWGGRTSLPSGRRGAGSAPGSRRCSRAAGWWRWRGRCDNGLANSPTVADELRESVAAHVMERLVALPACDFGEGRLDGSVRETLILERTELLQNLVFRGFEHANRDAA